MTNAFVPKFKPLPASWHQMNPLPQRHVLPTQESIIYLLLWLQQEGVWFMTSSVSSLGRYVPTKHENIALEDYLEDVGTAAWNIMAAQHSVPRPEPTLTEDILYRVEQGLPNTDGAFVLTTHLTPEMLAQALHEIHTGLALAWEDDERAHEKLYSQETYDDERYLEGWAVRPYEQDTRQLGFIPLTDDVPWLATLLRDNATCDYGDVIA